MTAWLLCLLRFSCALNRVCPVETLVLSGISIPAVLLGRRIDGPDTAAGSEALKWRCIIASGMLLSLLLQTEDGYGRQMRGSNRSPPGPLPSSVGEKGTKV